MTDTLTLGGRDFRPCVNSTLQHDIFTMNHIHASDVLNISMPEGSTGEDYAVEMLMRVATYEKFNELLGCLLIPADKTSSDWTPALCRTTGAFLASLTSPEDKTELNAVIAGLLSGFFQEGRVSLRISRKSSTPQA